MGNTLRFRQNGVLVLVLALVLAGAAGLAVAILNATPKTFWVTLGFLLLGASLGGLIALFVVNEVLRRRQRIADDDARRRLLRSVGGDAGAAISRIYGMTVAPNGPTFRGHELHEAWQLIVEGRLGSEGYHSEVYGQGVRAAHPAGAGSTPSPPRTWLTNDHMDLDIGLMMVERALGRAYARIDLFAPEEVPINDLQQAAQILEDGRRTGTLDDFHAASLLSALAYAVERSGLLLWGLGDLHAVPFELPHAEAKVRSGDEERGI